MSEIDFLVNLTQKLLDIGKRYKQIIPINQVEPLKHYFYDSGELKYEELDQYDGKFTRREILSRYLLVNIILDQGPDPQGVRDLLKDVTNELYRQEIRIFHKPLDFFKELGISIDEILDKHQSIKNIRAANWAVENKSSQNKYNLFFTQSMRGIVSTNQVLDYTIHRWGVPLSLMLLLEKDMEKRKRISPQPLIEYLDSYKSAEIMAQNLKNNERYGLGSAIGNKACHLFAKLYVTRLKLGKNIGNNNGWTDYSYELPFDSNAGRVLFRSGFLLKFASIDDLKKWEVIQTGKGKSKTDYIRVTNLRNKKIKNLIINSDHYSNFVKKFIMIGASKSIEIQRVPNFLIYKIQSDDPNKKYSIADFDDGLMHIGTKYCYNHDNPKCEECPLKELCEGYKNNSLIKNYRT